MSKIFKILILLLAVFGAVSAFYVLNSFIYTEKQAEPGVVPEPYRGTLTGEYVCLPHTDQTGPQTEECAYGLKTDVGEYYAIDFNLLSQSEVQFVSGERLTATGIITPVGYLSTNEWQRYPIVGIFSVTDTVISEVEDGESYACTADAKMCPDGSAVGRSGPNCEFAACPSASATSSTVTTYLGGSVTGLTVTVSPQEVVSDSRCPAEVTCIWAGTVEVRTTLATPVSNGEHTLTLGEPQVFGDYTVTLIGVTPAKTQEAVTTSSYRFTFEISKNQI